jgi:uncharacterized membrane protein (DUF2068 family)
MSSPQKGLKAVAILEATKGILALLVGFGLHILAGENIQMVAEAIVSHLHLNPTSELPSIFIHAASTITDSNIKIFTIAAIFYALVRFIEAYGLWRHYIWVEWFAFLSGAVYLPFEIYEIVTHMSNLAIAMFLINIVVVGYMGRTLWQNYQQRKLVRIIDEGYIL